MEHRLVFEAAGTRITVGVDPGALDALPVIRAFMPDLQASPSEPGPPDHPALFLGRLDGSWVVRDGSRRWTARELSPALERLELSLAETVVAAHDRTGIHAGGVVAPGGGATLLCGPGGSGKSSLTAALALRGAPVLGDDVVLLHGGRAHPFHRLLKVEEPARSRLGLERPPGPLSELWDEPTFFHPKALGSRWAAPAPVTLVVLPVRIPDALPRLQERRASSVLPTLLSQVVLAPRLDPGAFEAVTDALADARCVELRYWDSPAAADALMELWASG